MYVCMYARIYAYINVCVYVCMYTRIHAYEHEISTSTNVFVSAGKSTNLYCMSRESYKMLLNENITKN